MSKRIIELDIAEALEAGVFVGVDHPSWDLSKRMPIADLLSTSVRQTVQQTSHGFTVGTVLRHTGSSAGYTRAIATNVSNAGAIGIVSRVFDADSFEITNSGLVTGLTGLTAGAIHYVHGSVSGLLTTSAPIIRKEMLFAFNGTTGFVMTSSVQDLRPPTFMSITTPIRSLAGNSETTFTQAIPSLRFFGSSVMVSGLTLGNQVRVTFAGDSSYNNSQYVGSFTPVLFQDLSQGWLYRDQTNSNLLHIKVESLTAAGVNGFTITVEGEPL